MQYLKTDKEYVIRLIKGEKIIESLTDFCERQGITSGVISGLGAASNIELGYYSLETKEYHWKTFSDAHEIVNMTGNVAIVDGSSFLHIHMTISNHDFEAFGGHLKEATVGATCEVFLNNLDGKITRELDDDIGLRLLKM